MEDCYERLVAEHRGTAGRLIPASTRWVATP
jgi:hypothetical protein